MEMERETGVIRLNEEGIELVVLTLNKSISINSNISNISMNIKVKQSSISVTVIKRSNSTMISIEKVRYAGPLKPWFSDVRQVILHAEKEGVKQTYKKILDELRRIFSSVLSGGGSDGGNEA